MRSIGRIIRKGHILLCPFLFLALGCVNKQPPIEEYNLARIALKAAKDSEAKRYAPKVYSQARRYMRKAERGNTQETESSAKSTDDEAADEPEVNGLTEARSCDYIFCFSQTQNRLELVASTFKLLIAGATNFS